MLENATNQAPPTRGGKLWRLLVGEETEETGSTPPPSAPSSIAAAEPVWRSAPSTVGLAERVDRLETGLRLMSEALKRMHGDLSGSLAEIRAEVALTATSVDVRRTVAEGLEPVAASIESLNDTARALPLTLGAVAERLSAKIDALHGDLEETLITLIPDSWDPPPLSDPADPDPEAATPDPDFWGR